VFTLRKNKQIIEQLEDFFAAAQSTLEKTLKSLEYVIENGRDSHFETLVEEISEEEHLADNIRKTIEHKMFSQSLLPETREDILEIIEKMDNIPDTCEKVVYMVADQQITPIKKINAEIIELVKVGMECFKYTFEAARDFLGRMQNIKALMEKVDNYEHIADKLERKMIRIIFSQNSLTPGEKHIHKELVKEIGNISNESKRTAQRIIIASAKRSV
jgi:predicted phosphate transport protein (TIGR00153 family)